MNKIKGLAYHGLLPFYERFQHKQAFAWLWEKATLPVYDLSLQIHGSKALIPSVYHYPVVCRLYSTFNDPYLQLVYECWREKKRPLIIADIGAAVGDGFLFITKNLPDAAVERIYLVEPSPHFLYYLEKNINPKGQIIRALLSDKNEFIPGLVNIHGSTASAQGKSEMQAVPLDDILPKEAIDVLKIDVDGFDGKVLKGAAKILQKHHPALIFEFHPWLIKETGNDPQLYWDALQDAGYEDLLWFDKYGNFLHRQILSNRSLIAEMEKASFQAGRSEDLHYDVVALTSNAPIDRELLAKCDFAKKKPFPW